MGISTQLGSSNSDAYFVCNTYNWYMYTSMAIIEISMKASGIKLWILTTYLAMKSISQNEIETLIHQTEQNRGNSLLCDLGSSILLSL